MLLTTTDELEGYRVERYLGIVGGESVEGRWVGEHKQLLHETIQHAVNDLKRVASMTAVRSVVAYGTACLVVPTREPPPVLPPPPEDAFGRQ